MSTYLGSIHRRRIPPGAIRIDVPTVVQRKDYTCGPAALLAVCAHFGVGPRDQDACEAALGIDETGTDPHHLVRAARRWGLRAEEHVGMTDAALRACVERGRPVLIMLQAWAHPRPRSYRAVWKHGHWVVAIGFDRAGLYVEDPMVEVGRGHLTWAALDERWHDWGPHKERIHRYGLALWRPGRPPARGATPLR